MVNAYLLPLAGSACICLCLWLYLYVDSLERNLAVRVEQGQAGKDGLVYHSDSRQLVLNGRFILAAFREGSCNRKIFELLYSRPNEEILEEELKEVAGGRDIKLCNVADKMGFKGDLKKLIVVSSEGSIKYCPKNFLDLETIKL